MREETVHDTKCEMDLTIWIGQNAKDNWQIIDKANNYDIWFHLENFPSSHVILRLPDKDTEINKQTLQSCAAICKANSKYAEHKNISIIYTEIKNVIKGETVGSVYTKKTKTIKL